MKRPRLPGVAADGLNAPVNRTEKSDKPSIYEQQPDFSHTESYRITLPFYRTKKFARKRTIKWKNGINPGKGKMSRIDSKLDLEGLKAKLTELGFYGN